MVRGIGLLLEIIALAAGYVAAAQVGLAMAYGHGLVSPDWITTGLAVAALGLRGGHLWPGVALGAFIAYALAGNPPPVATGIALGNTFEAWAGGWMLRRWGVIGETKGVRDVAALVTTALLAPMPSAAGGALSPIIDGLAAWPELPARWGTWWLGDAAGILILTPPLLAWFGTRSQTAQPWHPWEAAATLAAGLAAVSAVFAGEPLFIRLGLERVPTLWVFPPMVWAGLRLRPRQAVPIPAAMALLAIGLTFAGVGPFAHGGAVPDLALTQMSFAIMVGTALVLVGAVAQLEEALCQAEAAMRRAQQATQRANEASLAKSRFVAALRHDFAQPLQAIRLFLQPLSRQPLDLRGRLLIERIEGAVEAIGAALDSLKDITAVELDLLRPEPASFPVGCLLAQLADEWRPQAAEKGLELRFVPSTRPVHTDRQMLGRIVRNLLANAVRYTARGRVLLGCRCTSGCVRIEVWDTGPGIPEEEQEAVFEAFHRGPEAKQQEIPGEAKGLGLGLATVRRLATALGLKLKLRSSVGRGSVFSVELPCSRRGFKWSASPAPRTGYRQGPAPPPSADRTGCRQPPGEHG